MRYAVVLTRDSTLASDIVSDVYLRAWARRESLRAAASPLSWLLTVTRNRATDEFRSRRPSVDLDQVGDLEDTSFDEEVRELSEGQKQYIREAIHQLTDEQQQVILLRFFQQLPHDEVARQLNRTPNAVRATQFRAINRLRKLLVENSNGV
jgi:RNA polymerase sigma-70 factor (ECF subfamily)